MIANGGYESTGPSVPSRSQFHLSVCSEHAEAPESRSRLRRRSGALAVSGGPALVDALHSVDPAEFSGPLRGVLAGVGVAIGPEHPVPAGTPIDEATLQLRIVPGVKVR